MALKRLKMVDPESISAVPSTKHEADLHHCRPADTGKGISNSSIQQAAIVDPRVLKRADILDNFDIEA